jgi:hypothetical protein
LNCWLLDWKLIDSARACLQVFDSVSELVQSALDGYHVCLFSYGQTGAGKTYTMSGGNTPEQQGLMPRAVNQVRTHCCAC